MRVTRSLKIVMIAAFLVSNQGKAREPDGTIRFTPLPMVGERALRSQFLPMLDYLTRKTKIEFRWKYIPDYDAVLSAQQRDEVDLTFLGPLPYVALTQQDPAFEPLVHFREKDGSQGYNCALVAFGNEGPYRATDVVNKRIGLTQPKSTCGYFAVSVMLARAGRAIEGNGNQHEYAGGHDKAIMGVVRGAYDVAGAKFAIARKHARLGIQIIDQAGPYPGFALVANNRTMTVEQRKAIRDALLTASQTERARWGEPMRNGAFSAYNQDYESLRKDLRRLDGTTPEGK